MICFIFQWITGKEMFQCYSSLSSLTAGGVFLQTAFGTLLVTIAFLVAKISYDRYKQRLALATLVVIGAGPVGLLSCIIGVKSKKISKAVIFEEKSRNEIINRYQQIAIEPKSLTFLTALGVDFDNIEGCWNLDHFFTRLGVFQEYLLSIIYRLDNSPTVYWKTKFTREHLTELDSVSGRLLVIICDGYSGNAANLLGLSDEIIYHSCKAYGAVASLTRPEAKFVPTPEIRVHNINFNLNDYSRNPDLCLPSSITARHSFHLKIFGSLRHRYMSILIQKNEAWLTKYLKVVLDQSVSSKVMRNIFQVCYNTFKLPYESNLSDLATIKCMKFSPRLYEVRLAQRLDSAVYYEDHNAFIICEGESSRCLNFQCGMDFNLSIRGLFTLEKFIKLAIPAESKAAITTALNYRIQQTKYITNNFVKIGLKDYMFT